MDPLDLEKVTAGMAPREGWVSVEDVATHLRVTKESIYRWIGSKGLPARRVGRLLRFKLSEVDEWVQAPRRDDSGSPAPTDGTCPKVPCRETSTKRKV
jgi:excisionase family DNA binding protein